MKLNKKFLAVILLIAIILISLYFYKSDNEKQEKMQIKIKNQIFFLKQAITNEEKSKGLMHITNLPDNNGMIFIFEDEQPRNFWMKNTLIPLDLIFLNKYYEIVDIKENFQPCKTTNCPSYKSKPSMYVIELNADQVKELNIKIGDKLKI